MIKSSILGKVINRWGDCEFYYPCQSSSTRALMFHFPRVYCPAVDPITPRWDLRVTAKGTTNMEHLTRQGPFCAFKWANVDTVNGAGKFNLDDFLYRLMNT